jgi:REP element-mobilizing transposase RayT
MLRGVNRAPIFLEHDDLARFIQAMTAARDASGCLILAYCLMPNHVHLIVQTTDEPIGLAIKRLGVRYAGWFNRKYDRVGHLFQDRFKSKPVEDDAYLITLLRYIWNNPVAAGLAPRAEEYPWSSRRFWAHPASWVDEDALRQLVPVSALAEAVHGDSTTVEEPEFDVTRPTDADAAQLLRDACGASNSGEFLQLSPERQSIALSNLRADGVSLRQCARVTGLSVGTVRRREARFPPR